MHHLAENAANHGTEGACFIERAITIGCTKA
jgi:hypothetical protein